MPACHRRVALLKAVFPTWSANEVRVRLEQTANDLLVSGRDVETGWGLLDCYRGH